MNVYFWFPETQFCVQLVNIFVLFDKQSKMQIQSTFTEEKKNPKQINKRSKYSQIEKRKEMKWFYFKGAVLDAFSSWTPVD